MASIGRRRAWGKWKHDKNNHYIEFWDPIGVGWCLNGNHSMSAGIIAGEGKLECETVRDISRLYEFVNCDGRRYFNRSGNDLGEVKSPEFAAIFEIGRLLVKHGISAFKN